MKPRPWKFHDDVAIVFKMFSVRTKKKRQRWQIPPVWKSVCEKLPFHDGLVWTGRPNVGIKLLSTDKAASAANNLKRLCDYQNHPWRTFWLTYDKIIMIIKIIDCLWWTNFKAYMIDIFSSNLLHGVYTLVPRAFSQGIRPWKRGCSLYMDIEKTRISFSLRFLS